MKRVLLVAVLALIGCGEAEGLPDCIGTPTFSPGSSLTTNVCGTQSDGGTYYGGVMNGNGFCFEADAATGKFRPLTRSCQIHWADGNVTYCDASPAKVGDCGTVTCSGSSCTELPQ